MRNFLIFTVFIILGIKSGADYIFSEKFQTWADREKAPWTCEFNNVVGRLMVVMSRYEDGYKLFSRTADRCPETSMAELAEYEMARCLDDLGRRAEAAYAYDRFLQKYKNSEKTKVAQRALQILRGGL